MAASAVRFARAYEVRRRGSRMVRAGDAQEHGLDGARLRTGTEYAAQSGGRERTSGDELAYRNEARLADARFAPWTWAYPGEHGGWRRCRGVTTAASSGMLRSLSRMARALPAGASWSRVPSGERLPPQRRQLVRLWARL